MKTRRASLALVAALGLAAVERAAEAQPARAPEAGRPAPCPGNVRTPRAGQLDPSFGDAGTGIARLRFGADDDGAFFALDRLGGGDLVAGGWGMGGLGGTRFRVARLTDAGAPVSTFGTGGMVTTAWASSTADYVYANAVGHQRGGQIVAMGWRERFGSIGTADVAMARYLEDGSLDPDFGDGGRSLLDLGGEEEIQDGLVLPNDRILLVGQMDDHLLVARATEDGALDRSFARTRGYRVVGVGRSSEALAVAVDRRGGILVAGSANIGGQRDMLLVRLNASGALDRTFGDRGVVVAGDARVDERAVAVAVSPEGLIVVAGDAAPIGGDRDFQVRVFLPDGSNYLGFGEEGVATPSITDADDEAEDMVVLPGGDVLVVGNAREVGATQPLVVRYTCQGDLDRSFGGGGVVRVDLGEYGVLHTVRRYSRDQVLLGGGDVGMTPGPGTYGVVARMWM